MLKLIGAVILLVATTGTGFVMASRLATRPKQIRRLIGALSILETEIQYGAQTLTAACNTISRRQLPLISGLFGQMAKNLTSMDGAATYDCLRLAVDEWWQASSMKEGEKEVFLQFCKTLGSSDRQNQLTHLALAKQNLKIEEEKARDEQGQYEKMVRTLGMLAGALLIILLY